MNKLATCFGVCGLALGLGLGAAWAETPEQSARDRTPPAKETVTALRAEIASPIAGAFAVGSQFNLGMQPSVGGFQGNGFLTNTGQPSGTGTPTSPGTYY